VWKKDEQRPQGAPEISTGTTGPVEVKSSSPSPSTGTSPSGPPVSARATACISQGIKIKGDVTGKEDLFVDGQIDGKLDISGSSVTIGPNAKVKADIIAREVIVRGRVDGKLSAKERVQLWSTAEVEGEVQTERLAIEDGALLRGKVEAGKLAPKAKEAHAGSSASSSNASSVSLGSGAATA
jgi:cytoskeletal protein CcmA (bactofilin family)